MSSRSIRMVVRVADELRFSLGMRQHESVETLGLRPDVATEGPRTLGELLEMHGYHAGDEVEIIPTGGRR